MKDITVLAIKGDERQSAAIEHLKKYMKVCEFEFPSSGVKAADVLFVPMLVSEGSFDKVYRCLKDKALILGGRIPQSVRAAFESRGYEVIDYASDESLKIKNALPTAEGVIGIAIENTKRTVSGSNVLITGFGCCAQQCARLFDALGANVAVAARSKQQRDSAQVLGYRALPLERIKNMIADADIIVNTVPAQIIGKDEAALSKRGALFIEIASYPFGIDRQAAEDEGIKLISAPGLPGTCAPVTSGEYIAQAVTDILLKKRRADSE